MKKFIIFLLIFLFGAIVGITWIMFDDSVVIQTNKKLLITQYDFAEQCRNICYENVMGEPYPGSCEEVQLN